MLQAEQNRNKAVVLSKILILQNIKNLIQTIQKIS